MYAVDILKVTCHRGWRFVHSNLSVISVFDIMRNVSLLWDILWPSLQVQDIVDILIMADVPVKCCSRNLSAKLAKLVNLNLNVTGLLSFCLGGAIHVSLCIRLAENHA